MQTPDPALHALNRFGLGARSGEREGLGDPRRWLERQLEGKPPELTTSDPDGRRASDLLLGMRDARRASDEEKFQQTQQEIRDLVADEARAVFDRRIGTDRPFVERLVAFWSNHLAVSLRGKILVAPLAGLYERQAIRPHVLGRFEDMVLASARHPGMLLYLDNAQSLGPGSRLGRFAARRERDRGLNENYARELLELHALGVDGGYDQEDVVELAKILTGWTVEGLTGGRLMGRAAEAERPGRGRRDPVRRRSRGRGSRPAARPGEETDPAEAVAFRFVEAMHEPGPKSLLGVTYRESGEAEGEAAIRALCRHPATARFLAAKLARHFIADDPPAAAVDRLAAVYQATRGDLREMARALVRLDAAWDPAAGLGRKLRTPQDWLVAALRAVGARETPPALLGILTELRHTPWAAPSPQGYGDLRAQWADPDALMNRAELARTMGDHLAARPALDPSLFLTVTTVTAGSPLPELLAKTKISTRERFALALGGPDFQWR